MVDMGIKIDVRTYGAAMSCMVSCSKPDLCFELMDRMQTEGIAMNSFAFNSAIAACIQSDQWVKGFGLYKNMKAMGVRRNIITFNTGTSPGIVLLFGMGTVSFKL